MISRRMAILAITAGITLWWIVQANGLPETYRSGVTDLSGYTGSDSWQHALAIQAGTVSEIFYAPDRRSGSVEVGRVPSALAIASYVARGFRSHNVVLVLQDDGDVIQLWFRSDGDVGSRVLGRIDRAIDLAGFEDVDLTQHALVLDTDGDLIEFTWKQGAGTVSRQQISKLAGAFRIGGFQAEDDGLFIVIAGDQNGRIREVFYRGKDVGGGELIGPGLPLA